MAEPFYTDGMTVAEILELGDDVLSSLDKRDLSRALRTVALAANKRLARLKKQAVKRKDGYVEKRKGKGISTQALNAVTDDGRISGKFGVGKKNRNQIYAEFARVRGFMGMKTSTVKGAVAVRKDMEKRAFGQTREQAGKGKTKKDQAAVDRSFQDKVKDTYREFRKFLELHPEAAGHNGSDQALANIGKEIIGKDKDSEDALMYAEQKYEEFYREQEIQRQKDIQQQIDSGVSLGGHMDEGL